MITESVARAHSKIIELVSIAGPAAWTDVIRHSYNESPMMCQGLNPIRYQGRLATIGRSEMVFKLNLGSGQDFRLTSRLHSLEFRRRIHLTRAAESTP